ncbi:MAG TPA: hypothetical protein VIS06_05085 [Mycobacteriales bacterium]
MYDSFAVATPLTGPHPMSRRRALLHWMGRATEHARVLVFADGACRVVRRGERLPLRDALNGAVRGIYHVDEDGHTTDLDCELPSRDGDPPFEARLRLLWWVHDVEQVVQTRVGEVRQALEPILEAYLGRVTREHRVAGLAAAEDRVRRELAGDLPLDIGLTVRSLAVTLRVERARVDQAVTPPDDPLAQVRRDILLEQERGRLALLRARNEVAAWQVRLAFYRNVVESGLPALLALRLMVDPSSATEVAGYVLAGRDGEDRPWPAWPDPDAVEGGRGLDERLDLQVGGNLPEPGCPPPPASPQDGN